MDGLRVFGRDSNRCEGMRGWGFAGGECDIRNLWRKRQGGKKGTGYFLRFTWEPSTRTLWPMPSPRQRKVACPFFLPTGALRTGGRSDAVRRSSGTPAGIAPIRCPCGHTTSGAKAAGGARPEINAPGRPGWRRGGPRRLAWSLAARTSGGRNPPGRSSARSRLRRGGAGPPPRGRSCCRS